jgi:VanZ family protein
MPPKSAQMLLRCAAGVLILTVAVVTLLPIEFRPIIGFHTDLERFAAFALLGSLLVFSNSRHLIIVFLLLISLIGLLELAQHLTSSRHGRIYDAIIKILGALFGAAVALLVRKLTRKGTRAK